MASTVKCEVLTRIRVGREKGPDGKQTGKPTYIDEGEEVELDRAEAESAQEKGMVRILEARKPKGAAKAASTEGKTEGDGTAAAAAAGDGKSGAKAAAK